MMGEPRILCADDDNNLAGILEKALGSEGYLVQTVRDGEQALARILGPEPPALVIASWMLPRLDGCRLLERIRGDERSARLPVLLTSPSKVSPDQRERARALRAQALMVKPVPLDRLIRCVGKYVKPGPPPAVPGQPRGTGAIAGRLSESSLPELLHQLHALQASGVLLIGSGKKRKALQLREGYPVSIRSNLRSECLGDMLVRRGVMSREQLAESTARYQRGEGMQGAILVAMDVMDESELAHMLHEQAKAKLFEAFGWPDGSYRFDIGRRIERANAIALEGSPANLIRQGIRQSFPMDRIRRDFERWSARELARNEGDFHRLQQIDLEPEDERLLAELTEPRTLADFGELGEAQQRALYGMVLTGLVELRDPAGGAPAARAPAERPQERRAAAAEHEPRRVDPEQEHALRAEVTQLLAALDARSHFELFGVEEDATPTQIKLASEPLLRKVHPDRFAAASGAVKQLAREAEQQIDRAVETLLEPKRRLEYLLELKKGRRRAQAERESQRALQAETAFQRGEAMMRERRYEMALVQFGEAIERHPEEGEYHAHYGWCLHLCHPDEASMAEEAIEHVRRGIKLARDHEKPYLYLGRLYKAVGRNAAAEKMFTRAVQIRPDCVEAMRELRLINLRRQKSKGLIGRFLRR